MTVPTSGEHKKPTNRVLIAFFRRAGRKGGAVTSGKRTKAERVAFAKSGARARWKKYREQKQLKRAEEATAPVGPMLVGVER